MINYDDKVTLITLTMITLSVFYYTITQSIVVHKRLPENHVATSLQKIFLRKK